MSRLRVAQYHAFNLRSINVISPLRVLERLQSGQPVNVIGFGDSITGVYYHTGAVYAWPELLGIKLRQRFPRAHIKVTNAGISGHTSAQGLARLEADVLSQAPHLVVVMFGMNDVVRTTLAEYAENLREIVSRIRAQGSDVILMTPNYVYDEDPVRPRSRLSEFAVAMHEIARETRTLVADAYLAYQTQHERGAETWMRLMSDPVHPNLRGHNLFADVIMATLCDQPLAISEPPAPPASLPHLAAQLRTRQPVRIVAMTPCDTLITTALKQLAPDTELEVIPWDTTGKTITQLEHEVLELGWTRYRDNPDLPQPNLFVVTAPPQLNGITRERFHRSFAMILNRTQRYDTAQWDCLPILPSILDGRMDASHREVEELMLNGAHDKGLTVIRRLPDEIDPPAELLARKLAALMNS